MAFGVVIYSRGDNVPYKDKQEMFDKVNTYNKKRYDVLRATPTKEEGKIIRDAAASAGQSVSTYILNAVRAWMKTH